MTVNELKQRLVELGVYEGSYSLSGGLPDERYVLDREPDGNWCVHYSERGKRTGVRQFDKEDEACDYLLKKLHRDKTVFPRPI